MKHTTAKTNKIEKGFTLIELLVVIGILAVLLAITLIAINPARQFAQANDTKRRSAATQILNAVGAYMADHHGVFPTALTGNVTGEIKSAAGQADEKYPAMAAIDLCSELVTDYMPALPQDPGINSGADIINCAAAGGYSTGYIITNASGRITVQADSEVNPVVDTDITVSR